jgi:ArsR family transcriptional regulator
LLEQGAGAKLDRHADQLAAIGHPVRLYILRAIVRGGAKGAHAGRIAYGLDVPSSTLSHHLKRLVDAGLIKSRSEGTFHYYVPEFAAIRALTEYVWEECCLGGDTNRRW